MATTNASAANAVASHGKYRDVSHRRLQCETGETMTTIALSVSKELGAQTISFLHRCSQMRTHRAGRFNPIHSVSVPLRNALPRSCSAYLRD